MTGNKRFMLDDAGELLDLNNHMFINYGDEVCNLLNELNDEIEDLKRQINDLKEFEYYVFKGMAGDV